MEAAGYVGRRPVVALDPKTQRRGGALDLFSEPSFRLSGGPKRSPSLNFARVRCAGVVEGLCCYLPMRFVSIGQPHVHHERISVVCAFDPSRARLWFQSHWDKSHFLNYPVVTKNLRSEGTTAFRSRRRRMIAQGLNRRQADSFRAASNPCHPPALRTCFPRRPVSDSLPSKDAPAAFLESWTGIYSEMKLPLFAAMFD
jgi:hypothetical protein